MKLAKSLILIDGYNVLRCGSSYKACVGEKPNFNDWQDESFNHAREALLNDASLLADSTTKVVIVFDGTHNIHSTAKPVSINKVEIIFSNYCFSADEVIIQKVFDNYSSYSKITVVSGDSVIQETLFSKHVNQMSVESFCQLTSYEHKQYVEQQKVVKHPSSEKICNLVDQSTTNKLEELFNKLS